MIHAAHILSMLHIITASLAIILNLNHSAIRSWWWLHSASSCQAFVCNTFFYASAEHTYIAAAAMVLHSADYTACSPFYAMQASMTAVATAGHRSSHVRALGS